MRPRNLLLVGCAIFGMVSASGATDPIDHRIMFAEYGKGPNRLVEIDNRGKVTWEHKFPSIAVIFEVLPDGHMVYAYGGPADRRA